MRAQQRRNQDDGEKMDRQEWLRLFDYNTNKELKNESDW